MVNSDKQERSRIVQISATFRKDKLWGERATLDLASLVHNTVQELTKYRLSIYRKADQKLLIMYRLTHCTSSLHSALLQT